MANLHLGYSGYQRIGRLIYPHAAITLHFFAAAVPAPNPATTTAATSSPAPTNLIGAILDTANDPNRVWDLSFIKKLAAVGDSYSAGIGAGNRLGSLTDLGAWACSRYSKSYPNLVNGMGPLGDPKGRNFQFHSCSGAKVQEVQNDQLPRTDSGQNAILLSAGGNDVDFVGILNQCIYQFFAISSFGETLLGKDGRFDAWKGWFPGVSRSCEQTLTDTQNAIKEAKFGSAIASLLTEAKKKLAPGGTIYYTGYSKFWSTDMKEGDQCDKINWSTFGHSTGALAGAGYQDKTAVTLTVARRKAMNDLIDAINSQIADEVKAAGSQVVYVDIDDHLGDVHGRFCEPGGTSPFASLHCELSLTTLQSPNQTISAWEPTSTSSIP